MLKKIKKYIKLFFIKKEKIYIEVLESKRLENKNILITGGGSGIGLAIAEACLRNSANVLITGRNKEKLEFAVNQLIQKFHDIDKIEDKIKYEVLDISNVKNIPNIIDKLAEKFCNNRIDVLVNNAGVDSKTIIGDTTEDDYDRTLDTNLKGTYFMCQEISNYMIRNKIEGNILNVSSSSGIRPAISPYMISKWGINGLTEGIAKKLIKYNIVVNGIAPGPTATGMLKSNTNDLFLESSPSKRYVDSNEVAELAVVLISKTGRMIVGETIYITGGVANLTKDDIKY